MSDYGSDNVKYKWTPESTTLLVSVWTDKQVQKQLDYAQRQQLIWESVARYMRKKGYEVTAKQCRSRMKQVLVCYREAKRSGTRAGVEQYYDSIDKVLKIKKTDHNDINGVDTVDSATVVKSPPKDVKTNKNLRMRFNKYSEPIESLIRTEALSPTWHLAHEEEYPDSPESNETVLAHPFRAFSPTRDAATNTLNGPSQLLARARRSLPIDEQPIRDSRHLTSVPNNRYGEMLYQNAVQNVQNQIIQENMQQRNILQNQLIQDDAMMQPEQLYRRNSTRNPFYPIDDAIPSKLRSGGQRVDFATSNNQPIADNMMRMQNQLQQTCATDNRAVPQEPRRANCRQNLGVNYKMFKEAPPSGCFLDQNLISSRTRQRVGNYSPDTAANLNDTFCQAHKDERNVNLNDSYDQAIDNDIIRGMNATTLTNNATFNDDTLSIEFLEGSPSPSDNGATGNRSVSGNSDKKPDAPLRKKKVQQLEQLMMSAISSQTEVVNKILAAQDAMVSRFLDINRDRQNRLEKHMDHLMNVVHATVLNKSADKDSEPTMPPAMGEPLITNLVPPPCPGVIPPKLDLVPPKPCRVACTTVNANVELVNQKPSQTRPGVVSPVKPPGAIWSKLGPVSQSPFVKAQQQLGLRSTAAGEARTQSSAERKIARELSSTPMDARTLIFETEKFLEVENRIEEQIENARILEKLGNEVAARRKLFAGRGESNAAIILTSAFLDAEREAASVDFVQASAGQGRTSSTSGTDDEELVLLAGQVEKYERLRRLNMQSRVRNEPCDTSTPAKTATQSRNAEEERSETVRQAPRQTIQQLAELVMKSARWRDATVNNRAKSVASGSNDPGQRYHLNVEAQNANKEVAKNKRAEELRDQRRSYAGEVAERESRDKALGWLQNRYSYEGADQPDNRNVQSRPNAPYEAPIVPSVPIGPHPMGFTTENLNVRENKRAAQNPVYTNRIGFNPDILVSNNFGRRNVAFADLEAPQTLMEKTGQATYPRQRRQAPEPPQQQHQQYYDNNRDKFATLPVVHRHMIDRYVQDCRGPFIQKQNGRDGQDSDDDEEFLDTTTTMPPRKTSLTLSGNSSGKGANNCTIS